MGLFDEIRCDAPLPDGYTADGAWFQTKSFPHPGMQRYTIGSDRRLTDSLGRDLEADGYIGFYITDPDGAWREYRAKFSGGRLEHIRVVAPDAEDNVRYGLASYRWFSAPSFLFGDPDKGDGA